MKVLIAENDRAPRTRIRALLKEWGHDCLTTSDVDSAWRLLQRHRPRLVITDWVMPDLDAVSLLKRIRDRESSRCHVIVLTGKESMAHLVEAMEAGADDFIRKPFDPEELRVRVRAGERIMEQQQRLEQANEELSMAYLKLHVANGRMRSELQAAAEIQDAFLPTAPPPVRQATFAWYHKSCEAHSGDTFNFVPIDPDHVGLYVASCSGEGVGSALLSAQLSLTLSRQTTLDGDPMPMGEPAAMAHWLNDRFRYFDRLRYFTFLYGILDFQQRTLRYTSAAHPGPIVISRGRARHCHLTPPAVGFQEDARFRNRTLHLHPGDRIYLYNTAFFGPRNALGERFTEDVLTDLLLAESHLPIEEGVNRAGVRALEWDPSGHLRRDLCLVGVEINNGNAPA